MCGSGVDQAKTCQSCRQFNEHQSDVSPTYAATSLTKPPKRLRIIFSGAFRQTHRYNSMQLPKSSRLVAHPTRSLIRSCFASSLPLRQSIAVSKLNTITPFGVASSGWLLACCVTMCGCEKVEKISSYPVVKHESLQTAEYLANNDRMHPKPERMIGLVVPKETTLWFFKLQGNVEAVTARENDVREFLKTLQFPSNEQVEWTLPAGWKQLDASEMRYATLVLDGEPPLEMSVTKFPGRDDLPQAEQVVMNINRWRGQLSLPPIRDEDLADQTEQIPISSNTAYWTSIVGRPRPKPAAMKPPERKTTPAAETKTEQSAEKSAPAFNKPEGWTDGPPAKFAAVSLQVLDGEKKAAITVTSAGGSPLLNVNRWRGQVRLGPLTEEQLAATAKKVEVGQMAGNLYEMSEEGRSIFGVIVENQGQMWFAKMDGDTPLVERERERFIEFLKSLHL